mgnify:CR=1 FL=1
MASIISAGTTSATALNMSADTSGVLQLASNNGTVALTVATDQKVGIGTTIWVAKVNNYNWGIYRCSPVPGRVESVTSNLNGTSSVVFTQTHNLAVGAVVILKYVNTQVDGVYRVLSVPSINTITIFIKLI